MAKCLAFRRICKKYISLAMHPNLLSNKRYSSAMASSIIIYFSYLNQIEAITYSTWVFKIPENDFDQPNGKDISLQWRHNEHDGVLNHQPHECLLNRLFKAQIKENIKAPRHWPLWGEFTGHPWIPRTKGQWRGKCFHLMTSSCFSDNVTGYICPGLDMVVFTYPPFPHCW